MVRLNRDSQFELNALKISQNTKQEVRKPYVWQRPNSRLYDFHYEIGGLYYQPMLQYIEERGSNGPHKLVDMPDRIQSNFDRRAYILNNTALNLEEFLTEAYKRRSKDVNGKYVHVENEKIRHSKKNTDLGTVRGSACIRDKYLCQLQLYYTGSGANLQTQDENLEIMEKKQKFDDYYAPGYSKVVLKRGEKSSKVAENRISENLESKYMEDEESLNKLKTDNELEILNITTQEALERCHATQSIISEEKNRSSSYMVALSDVKRKIYEKKKDMQEITLSPMDVKIVYSGKPIDTLGLHERSRMKAEQFNARKVPDIDVGYDTVERIDAEQSKSRKLAQKMETEEKIESEKMKMTRTQKTQIMTEKNITEYVQEE